MRSTVNLRAAQKAQAGCFWKQVSSIKNNKQIQNKIGEMQNTMSANNTAVAFNTHFNDFKPSFDVKNLSQSNT